MLGFSPVSSDPVSALPVASGGVVNYTLTAQHGTYAITGQPAVLLRSKLITANSGTYSYTGQSANLLRSKLLTATNGTYALTGQSANIIYTAGGGAYTLTAQAGSYAVTGQSATLTRSRLLTASSGAYSVTGQSASILRSKLVTASAGAYSVTGQQAGIAHNRTITALSGTYAVSGQSATITKSTPGAYTITALNGSYSIAGQDATLTKTGGTPSYSAEIELKPRKFYVKRKKQILIFDSAEQADAFLDAEMIAEDAVQQAQKTSRLARKRLRTKIFKSIPLPEVVAIDFPEFRSIELPDFASQQDLAEFVRIALIAQDIQDEDDIECLLMCM